MTTLWQDIRYGWRMLMKNPGFTAMVLLVLAVGVGATTAMLGVVDAVMLRPCPYRDAGTLAWVCETDSTRTHREMVSIPNFRDWREQNHVFESLVAANRFRCIVSHADRTERSEATFISDGFFSTLGVEPILGRTFLPEERESGERRAVILSYDRWQRWFGGDPNVTGHTLILDAQVYTVVGVLPESFRWVLRGEACGLWVPMHPETATEEHRSWRGTDVVGRLKPGVDLARAQAEMDVIADRLARAYPDKLTDTGILVVPMQEAYKAAIGWSGNPHSIVILLSIVSAVLLISCIHVASLLTARSVAREREMAVRAALGAHRSRIIQQLLTESVLVAALGGLCGLALAYWGVNMLSALKGSQLNLIPWFIDLHIGGRSFLYVLAISALACAFFGVLPSIWTSRINFGLSLSAGRTPGYSRRFHAMRASLVVADIAIAFVVLIGAGLMVNTYTRIVLFDTHVNSQNVLSMTVEFNEDVPPYSESNRREVFLKEVLERLASLPGVRCAALANTTPAWPGYNYSVFAPEGLPPDRDPIAIRRTTVTGDYFRVFEIPLLQGRSFTEQETAASAPVAIINEAMAQRLWPNQSPLGKYIAQKERDSEPSARQIVGVVGNIRHYLRYFVSDSSMKSLTSFPDDVVYIPGYNDSLMVRTEGNPMRLLATMQKEVRAMDATVVLADIGTVEGEIAALFSPQRFNTLFLGAFGTVALILTSIGIYGTIAYAVSRRTHEIGIRMALGARRVDVLRVVLKQGIKLVLAGIVIGIAGAFALTRTMTSLLHDVSPTDPLTFACISFLLVSVALLASYVPARRAARIDPMTALRYE